MFIVIIIFTFLIISTHAKQSSSRKREDSTIPPHSIPKDPSIKDSQNGRPQDYIMPCLSGWYPFRRKCYKAGGFQRKEYLTWKEASQKCMEYEAHLVSIHSKEEQDFLISNILLNVGEDMWIGLHDSTNESLYEWVDKSQFDFAYWHELEPSGLKDEKEDCVEMRFTVQPSNMGRWNDNNCDARKKYICEMPEEPKGEGTNPIYCPESLGYGYSFQDSCYHVVQSPMTWIHAEEYCKERFQGNLVAITDFTSQMFLKNLVKQLNIVESLWIGIHVQPGVPLRWSSGWFVAYSYWDGDEEDQESCAVRLKTGEWDTEPCKNLNCFICEVNLNKAPYLEASAEGGVCPQNPKGWIDLGGDSCYYFDKTSVVSWYESNFNCIRRGGVLTSIHSEAESDAIEQFIRYSQYSYHIGLFRTHNNSFQWLDGSNFNIDFWDDNEPNSDREKCVELIASTMAWNDISCRVEHGYICSVPKVFPQNVVDTGTTDCSGTISAAGVIGVAVCVLLVVLFFLVFLYFCRPWEKDQRNRFRKISRDVLQAAHTKNKQKIPEIIVKDDSCSSSIK